MFTGGEVRVRRPHAAKHGTDPAVLRRRTQVAVERHQERCSGTL